MITKQYDKCCCAISDKLGKCQDWKDPQANLLSKRALICFACGKTGNTVPDYKKAGMNICCGNCGKQVHKVYSCHSKPFS